MDTGAERTDLVSLPASTTRLVVLGDPHGDLVALDEVLSREARADTAIVSVGDNVGYADAVVCSELCRLLAVKKIASVRGNHEAWSLGGKLFLPVPGGPSQLTPEATAFCEALPHRLRVEAAAWPELRVSVVHTLPGWAYVQGPDDAGRLLEQEGTDLTFSGHTHAPAIYELHRPRAKPRVRRVNPDVDLPIEAPVVRGARTLVDAGSLARPTSTRRRGISTERGTYAVLDLVRRTVKVVAFGKRRRMREILERMIEENTRELRGGPPPPRPAE